MIIFLDSALIARKCYSLTQTRENKANSDRRRHYTSGLGASFVYLNEKKQVSAAFEEEL